MVKDYATKGLRLKYRPLPDDVLLSIAKIVRAWGEIESVIDLYIQSITSLTPSQLLLFLGRQTISTKITLAGKLAKLKGARAHKRYQKVFGQAPGEEDYLGMSLKFRNVLAHGHYVGIGTDGKYAFLTNDVIGFNKTRLATEAHCIHPDNLSRMAAFSEILPYALLNELKLGPPAEKWLPQYLGPHPKAPQKPRKKVKIPQRESVASSR